MAVEWPSTLPQYVLQDNYQEVLPKAGMETQMEAGPPKTRRRFTTNWRQFTCSVKLTLDQQATFEAFWMGELAMGTLPFNWVNPRTQQPATFRFHPASPPTYSAQGEVMVCAFTMEQLN